MDDLDPVPAGLTRDLGPDAEAKAILNEIERFALCGGRFAVEWTSGPWKGKRLAVYCQQPRCIETGSCTGPMFVPTFPQFDSDGRIRHPEVAEMIAGVREGAKKATGKDDPRSDRQIVEHIRRVTTAVRAEIKSKGWTL